MVNFDQSPFFFGRESFDGLCSHRVSDGRKPSGALALGFKQAQRPEAPGAEQSMHCVYVVFVDVACFTVPLVQVFDTYSLQPRGYFCTRE